MALKYHLYSYSCHIPSKSIFGYSFVEFWATEYFWIFVRKFVKNWIYLNICSEPYSNIWLSTLSEKVNLDIIWFRGSSELFFNHFFNQWWVWIFKYSNNITLEDYSYFYLFISKVRIYLDICLVNMLHLNLFKYLFGTYCSIGIYLVICSFPFYDIRSSLWQVTGDRWQVTGDTGHITHDTWNIV